MHQTTASIALRCSRETLRLLNGSSSEQECELTAEVIDEIFSPLLMGGTGIVATEPVTAAGIPFLASIAMALPTMRGILGAG